MGELKKLVEEGKIKYVGLSEASAATIRKAHAVHPVSVVQLEWSLWARDVEDDIVPTCRELGIAIVAYSPLGRGYQGNDVCPIPGTTKVENFNQNVGAFSVKLTTEDMAELEAIASADAIKGERYMPCSPTYETSEMPPLSWWKAE